MQRKRGLFPELSFVRLAGFLGILVGLPLAAFAHSYLPLPETPGATTTIPDMAVSRAAYRELTRDYPVDRFEFKAEEGETIFIQMTIPKIARLTDFSPSIAIVSGATNWNEVRPSTLVRGTIALGDPTVKLLLGLTAGQYSLTVDYDGGPPREFHEPFTDTDYWIKQTIRFTAPVDGSYRIEIFHRDGKTGKYVLATGEKERFTLREIFEMPKVRKTVRRFSEVE